MTLAVAAPPGELGEIFIAGPLLARVRLTPQRLLRLAMQAWVTTLRGVWRLMALLLMVLARHAHSLNLEPSLSPCYTYELRTR